MGRFVHEATPRSYRIFKQMKKELLKQSHHVLISVTRRVIHKRRRNILEGEGGLKFGCCKIS